MTAQDYIQTKLDELKQPTNLNVPTDENELIEAIYHAIMSKKFRKYAANEPLQEHIKGAIRIAVENQQPIKIVFTQGAYKLWRLEESPEADWAELFAAMYYTKWLKPVCELYEPGVWMDYFVDDLILAKLDDVSIEESNAYRASFQHVLDFLKQFQPSNLKMTITGVGDQFESPEAFYKQLDEDTEKFSKNLPDTLPEVSEENAAMIELNAKPSAKNLDDPQWMQKNKLMHDAYLAHTKAETGYHNQPDKIKVFSQPLSSGMFLAIGTTKDSVAKHWAGVGVLKPRHGDYRQIILTPTQLEGAKSQWQDLKLEGLDGKNFYKIRVLTE